MYKLVLIVMLFAPAWTPDDGKERNTALLQHQEIIYDSQEECVNNMRVVAPASGVYTQSYPDDNAGFKIALTAECHPLHEVSH